MKLVVFCSGYGSNFQAIIDAVKKKKIKAKITLMVCDQPKAFAIERAKKAKIPLVVLSPRLFKTRESYEKLLVTILKAQAIDLVILAGFMRILSPYFLKAYNKRILNIHPSFLPAFKGGHAIADAFQAGVRETGVTVHVVTQKVDSGPIVIQRAVKILKNDTLESLETRIHKVEHALYPQAINQYIQQIRRK